MKKNVIVCGACAMVLASSAFAGGRYWNVDGTTTMNYLSMKVSPRSASMSGAGVADASRVSEVSRNPLAMSAVQTAEFGFNQVVFDDASGADFVSAYFGLPVLDKLTFSATVDYLGYDDLEGRDENGLQNGEFGAYSWGLQLGLGSHQKVFNWAVSFRFATQTIDDESNYGFLGDLGASYNLGRYFSFATTLTNAGYITNSEYDDAEESAPMALQAGITGKIPFASRWNLHLSADTYRRADTDVQWLFGGEIIYAEILMLRAGYALRPSTEDGLSAGLGVSFGSIVFDYGYSPRPAFEGGNHYLSLGLKF
ncbi:MAG: PorV/PorQ family protein [Fibrobacteraceae bacterium]|nr:PorV/PorQ family protein [Fibrobacteraceae bacterium]